MTFHNMCFMASYDSIWGNKVSDILGEDTIFYFYIPGRPVFYRKITRKDKLRL